MHPMVLLVTRHKWKLDSVHLETVLILTQDRCTVCGERATGLEIVLDLPNGLLGDVGHVESHLGPFGVMLVSVKDRCRV
jgi:hypothetical protein